LSFARANEPKEDMLNELSSYSSDVAATLAIRRLPESEIMLAHLEARSVGKIFSLTIFPSSLTVPEFYAALLHLQSAMTETKKPKVALR
jgi:hypothetical protein